MRAFRQDVLAKCYLVAITRTTTVVEEPEEGKARMKQLGCAHVSQGAFWAVLAREG